MSLAKRCELKVILDLDEVLVHTYEVTVKSMVTHMKDVIVRKRIPHRRVVEVYGESVQYRTDNDRKLYNVKFVKRPWLTEFLHDLEKLCALKQIRVIFWTASLKEYADSILNRILPQKSILRSCQRLYRRDCLTKKVVSKTNLIQISKSQRFKRGSKDIQNLNKFAKAIGAVDVIHYKDLSKVFNEVQMKRAIIIDDSKHNIKNTEVNGILAPKWEGKYSLELAQPSFLKLVSDLLELMIGLDDITEVTKPFERELWASVEKKKLESLNNERRRSSISRIGSARLNKLIRRVKTLQ